MARQSARICVMEERQDGVLRLLRDIGTADATDTIATSGDQPMLIPGQVVPGDAARSEDLSARELRLLLPNDLPGHVQDVGQTATRAAAQADERLTRDEVRRMIGDGWRLGGHRSATVQRPIHNISPLAQEVLAHPAPPGFKLPSFEAYDGTNDPVEHIKHFATVMRFYNAPDQLLCQVFPTTLQGPARTWFHSLKEGEVNDFAELARLFTDQFAASKRIVRDPSYLSGIQQVEGESLKDFFGRFTTEARKIPGVSAELLRCVFIGGLQPGKFHSMIMREVVPSYPDLIHQVEAQIAVEEAIEAHHQQFVGSSKRQRGAGAPVPPFPKKGKRHCDNSLRPGGHQHHRNFTPLNTSRSNILLSVSNSDSLRRPRPLPPNTGNQSRYCNFHRGHGHKTEDCARLKEEIERLIHQGLLEKFLKAPRHNR